MKKIRCLIFDLGGVITLPQRIDKVDDMMATLGARCPRAEFLVAYGSRRGEYDRGVVGLADYWRDVAMSLGMKLDREKIGLLGRLDIESWFNINEETIAFIERSREMVAKLVLLSNLPEPGARHLRGNYPWIGYFDHVVLSCELRLLKPDPAIYRACSERSGIPSEESLFFDDSSENAEGARRAGMNAIRFEGMDSALERLRADYFLGK